MNQVDRKILTRAGWACKWAGKSRRVDCVRTRTGIKSILSSTWIDIIKYELGRIFFNYFIYVLLISNKN